MKVNTKIRYGLRAVIEIAKHDQSIGVLQKEISKNQNISNKYLDHIINGLKIADVIRRKDIKGGFVLSRPASEITVYDIYNSFEVDVLIVKCLDRHDDCELGKTCDVRGFWCELNKTIAEKFKSVTIENLILKNNYEEYCSL